MRTSAILGIISVLAIATAIVIAAIIYVSEGGNAVEVESDGIVQE